MLTNSQAYTILERHESDCRRDPRGVIRFRYGYSELSILHTPDQPDRHQYWWGPNIVERHTALLVVKTFEQGVQR